MLTEGMSREARARLLEVSARTLSRYEKKQVKPSRKVLAKIETVILRAQMAVAADDDVHLTYRMEELRANREALVQSIPIDPLVGNEKDRDLPPLWLLCARYVTTGKYVEAWELGSRLVDDLNYHKLPGHVKSYCLVYLSNAADYTGRLPEALELVERALATCSPEQHPLHETILSNKASILAQIGSFDDAYEAIDLALQVDGSFILALYNGLSIACMRQIKDEVVDRRDRLLQHMDTCTPKDGVKLLGWLRADPTVTWGCEQGLLEPLIKNLEARWGIAA